MNTTLTDQDRTSGGVDLGTPGLKKLISDQNLVDTFESVRNRNMLDGKGYTYINPGNPNIKK